MKKRWKSAAAKFADHVRDEFVSHVESRGGKTVVTSDRSGESVVIAWNDADPWGPFLYEFWISHDCRPDGSVGIFVGDPETEHADYTYHAAVPFGSDDERIRAEFVHAEP